MEKFIDNIAEKQYQLHLGEKFARIEYIHVGEKIYLTHTEVPPGFEGQGIGSKIIHLALEDIKARDLTLIPLCPFVAGYLKKHPEYRSLVLKGINIA